MKCDDFLPSLESGAPLRRWSAHRHAQHCPKCAAALAMLDQVKQALAPSTDEAALPPRLRRRWIAAAGADVSAEPSSLRYQIPTQTIWLKRTAALAAIILLVLVPALLYKHHKDSKQIVPGPIAARETITIGPITVTQIDRADELLRLDNEIVQLQSQVASLINAAERLEAQQRIVLVLAQNSHW